MALLDVLMFPNKSLRIKARKIPAISDDERRILSDMAETMYFNKGVGLAATQIGVNKELIVIDIGDGLMKIVNPDIVYASGYDTQEEGCLSVPDIIVKVRRAKEIRFRFLNENGESIEKDASGLLARAIQHEIDHLRGKVIVDYLHLLKRLLLKSLRSVKTA